jgi:hypothetical protein
MDIATRYVQSDAIMDIRTEFSCTVTSSVFSMHRFFFLIVKSNRITIPIP